MKCPICKTVDLETTTFLANHFREYHTAEAPYHYARLINRLYTEIAELDKMAGKPTDMFYAQVIHEKALLKRVMGEEK